MQTGFALLEMGSSRAGNEVNILLKNVADVLFGSLAYYLLGFGLSFGEPSNPFMGLGDFAPGRGGSVVESGLFYSLYIFQLSFAATSTTIVSGCVAMRMKFVVYCAFSFFAVVFYGFAVHWIWAEGGWLAEMGVMDFAGGGPVHLFGGINGLVGILFVGPRTGRYDGSRPRSDFVPVSPTSTLFGLLILWWAWLGFNCGSSFGITGYRWVVATRCALTTINASAAGGIVAMIKSLLSTNRRFVQPLDVSSGILGSLVAITPACASVKLYDAYIIGALGGLVGLYCIDLLNHFEVDDPVGAVGVHAGSAIWGLIAVGLFADGNLVGVSVDSGLFRGGGLSLLGVQCLEIVVIIGWSLLFSGTFFYLTGILLSCDLWNPRKGLRVSIQEEEKGADAWLHGLDRSILCGDEDESTTAHGFRDSAEDRTMPRRQHHSSRRPRQTQLMFRSFRRESARLPRFSRHGSFFSRSFRRKGLGAEEDARLPNQDEAEETTEPTLSRPEVIDSLEA